MVFGQEYPFDEIADASPEALGMRMLKRDPHAVRLNDRSRIAAISDALADGTAAANALRWRFPGLRPLEIANELQIPVVTSDDEPMVSTIWRFAEYQPRPRIVLYLRGIDALERALTGRLAEQLLGTAEPRDVFVAHELYHHVETTRPDLPVARRHRAVLLQIGGWQWQTGIATLSEIAAGSFAQALLELPCHPKALDDVMCRHIATGIHSPQPATPL